MHAELKDTQPPSTGALHKLGWAVQALAQILLGAALLFAGISHLTVARTEFLAQVPTWLPVDGDMIPLGPTAPVEGTHLDFRKPVLMATRLDGPPIDHNLCLSTRRRVYPQKAATLRAGRVSMSLRSTEPGLQVYTANHFSPGAPGIGGAPYGRHAGIALESQIWPDAPNHADYPSALLLPGQLYRQVTLLSFQSGPATR